MTKAEESQKRALEDYSQFSQHLRAALQFTFAANGGAALAMLSCLTSLSTATKTIIDVKALLNYLACAAGFYLTGVICTVVALYIFAISKENWGHFHEDNVRTGRVDFEHTFAVRAAFLEKAAHWFLGAATLMFILGSFAAVLGFVTTEWQKPGDDARIRAAAEAVGK